LRLYLGRKSDTGRIADDERESTEKNGNQERERERERKGKSGRRFVGSKIDKEYTRYEMVKCTRKIRKYREIIARKKLYKKVAEK